MKRDCLKEELIELLLHSDAEVDRLGLQVSDLKKRNEVLETQSEYISLLKCRTQLKVAEDRIYELEKEQSEVKEENQVMRNQIEKLTVNQSDWLTYKTLTQKQKHLIEKMEATCCKFSIALKDQSNEIQQITDEKKLLTSKLYNPSSEKTATLKQNDMSDKCTSGTSDKEAGKSVSKKNNKQRIDYSKNKMIIKGLVNHVVSKDEVPDGARIIGHRTMSKIEIIPMQIKEHIYHIDIYSYDDSLKETSIDLTPVLNKCKADSSLLSFILVNKYLYHLPIERQLKILEEAGLTISKSTLNDWLHRSIKKLRRIEDTLYHQLRQGAYFFIDETTHLVCVLDKESGKRVYRKKYIWGLKSKDVRLAVYLYDQGSRGKKVIEKFFGTQNIMFTSDGYIVYKSMQADEGSNYIRGGCMAHARRKMVESLPSDPRANWFINKIADLYRIERQCKESSLDDNERLKVRKKNTLSILGDIYQELKRIASDTVTYYSKLLLKAVNYMLNDWKALTKFTCHGIMEIDNNLGEQLFRPIKLGGNNWLFSGSEDAAQDTAFMYTLIESCKLNNIRPKVYIEEMLRKLVDDKDQDLKALLPCNWVKLG